MNATDHPLLAASLTESLRKLFRHHLSEAPGGRAVLDRLAGQVIALRLEPFGKVVYLCPTDADVQVLTEISGTPNVTISGNLAAFTRAGLGGGREVLKTGNLEITGNAETARQFQALTQALNIDWQRFLSRYLGFRLTGSLLSAFRAGSAWTRSTAQALEADLGEFLHEEARWLPDGSAIDDYCAEVDTLRADTDRLQARIRRLETAHSPLETPGNPAP